MSKTSRIVEVISYPTGWNAGLISLNWEAYRRLPCSLVRAGDYLGERGLGLMGLMSDTLVYFRLTEAADGYTSYCG